MNNKCMGLYEYSQKDVAYVAPFYHFQFFLLFSSSHMRFLSA